MVAGRSNVSKHRSTTNVAWSPPPPRKKKEETSDFQKGVEHIKKGRTNQSTKDALKMLEEY